MSEQLKHSHESIKPIDLGPEHHHKPDHEKIAREEAHQAEVIEEMDRLTDALAISAEDINIQQHGENRPQHFGGGVMQKELKAESYQRSMRNMRAKLNAPEKLASKVIHQPVVDKVSSIAEKTIARPRGLALGGAFAFFGSCFLLFIAKRYGFEYNFLMFLILFLSGYIIATALEIISKPFRKSHN